MKQAGGRLSLAGAIVLAAAAFLAVPAHGGSAMTQRRITPATSPDVAPQPGFRLDEGFGRLPLYFIRNQGQVDPRASFYAKTGRYTLWLGADGLVFDRIRAAAAEGEKPVSPGGQRPEIPGRFRRDVSRLEFVGANLDPQISGEREQPCRVNYFIGNDSSKWKTAIATFAEVRYRNLYKSIDLRVYGAESRIEYDWEVLPGGDPRAIRFHYAGVKRTRITPAGDLLVETATGKLTHKRPAAYQEIEGRRVAVAAGFKKLGKNEYGFETGGYDRSRALTIDPLVYASFLGGSDESEKEYGWAVALDGSGNAYVTGTTQASDFPVSAGAYDSTLNGSSDVFITKVNAAGTAIVFSTFLGGTGEDIGLSIALNTSNMVYVSGQTGSSSFPTTAGAYDASFNGSMDAFVAKLTADGSGLAYATYLGGSARDEAWAIAHNGSNLFVTGKTFSSDFPATAGAYDTSFNDGEQDVFVAKFNVGESALDYSTFIGGSSWDWANGIAVDGSGNAYVAGATWSDDYPVTAGAFDATRSHSDGIVTKINASGSALVWSTYLGGSGYGGAFGIRVDGSNCATVCGYEDGSDFPVTAGAFDESHNGGYDAYVCKFNAAGTALLYSTYLGGNGDDKVGQNLALGGDGSAYIVGSTASADFPATSGAHDSSYNGNQDAFVARLTADGSGLAYATFLGGTLAMDTGRAIAVSGDDFCLVGETEDAADFPVTSASFDTVYDGLGETFVAKFSTRAITVISPNGGESYNAGSNHDIFWSASPAISSVIIYVSTDNGTSWGLAAANVANDGFEYWIVPAVSSATCRVKVCNAANPAEFDISNEVFTIASSSGETISSPTVPSGASAGEAGVSYSFTTGGAVSSLGHNLRYMFDWGDGTNSGWLAQGVTSATHSWNASGTYPVRALARCSSHVMMFSLWSDSHAVAIGGCVANDRDDLLATWDGQGVYYKDSDSGAWVKLASPATLIANGDLDGDCIDDIIGIWPTQGGVWVKYSASGAWAKLSTTARHIGAGDMNGDGRVELLGTWDGQGVYWRDNDTGAWTKLASPATLITSGDLDNDGTDDLIGIWPSQGGVWVKYSSSGSWAKLSTTAVDIASGDMNGDGRDELLATWDGQGVYYRTDAGAWVKMASPATQVTAGDLDGDGTDDVIGIWPSQAGVWVKYSQTGSWALLGSTARDIGAGRMRAAGGAGGEPEAAAQWDNDNNCGPDALAGGLDLSEYGPGGRSFHSVDGENMEPRAASDAVHVPGPGEPGFTCAEQANLEPRLTRNAKRESDPEVQ